MTTLSLFVTSGILICPNLAMMNLNEGNLNSKSKFTNSQRFLVTPESREVMEGEEVRLRCSVDNLVGVLQWTKDDFGLGTLRELPGYDR